MARPQVIVNVAPTLPRRGLPTATGTAFLAFSAPAATGTTGPLRVGSARDVTDEYGDTAPVQAFAALVGDCLAEGAPVVVVVRATGALPEVTEEEWGAALGQLTEEYGPGQVAVPGVATTQAHAALVAHAEALPSRVVFLDADPDATSVELLDVAATAVVSPAAGRVAVVAPWVTVPAPAGLTREVPGSVVAAALAARGDAVKGHTNHAPAGDQGRGAGLVDSGLGVTATFTADELDDLHDGGVSVVRMITGRPVLYGWRSTSTDERFLQLSAGRFSGQLGFDIHALCQAFLFRQLEPVLFAELEGALRGYLLPFWPSALFGDDPDEAFDVEVAGVNTFASIARGELRAAVAVRLTPHTERVVIDVVTQTVQGA